MLGAFRDYGNSATQDVVKWLPVYVPHPLEIPSHLLSTRMDDHPNNVVVDCKGDDFLSHGPSHGLQIMSADVVVKEGLYILYKGQLDIHQLISFYEEMKKKGHKVHKFGKEELLPGKYKVILFDKIRRKVLFINTMKKGPHFRYGFAPDGYFVVSDDFGITSHPWLNLRYYMSRGCGVILPLDKSFHLLGVFPFMRPDDINPVASPAFAFLKSFTSVIKYGNRGDGYLATLAYKNSGTFYAKDACHMMWEANDQANEFEDLFADLSDAFKKLKENNKNIRDHLRLDGGWEPFPLKKKWIRGDVKLNCIVYDEFVIGGELMRYVFAYSGLETSTL